MRIYLKIITKKIELIAIKNGIDIASYSLYFESNWEEILEYLYDKEIYSSLDSIIN